MAEPNENENTYAKWLNGELTAAELEELQAKGELPILEKIVSEVDTWQLPKVKSSYGDFKAKLAEKERSAKRRRIVRLSLSLAAAILLLLVAIPIIYTQYFNTVEYQTLAGQSQKVSLPDGTQVTLNGASLLSYHKFNWNADRKVDFKGQAFFNVQKKGAFEVILPNASIQVTGTKFDVQASDAATSIKCFEGEVLVNYQGKDERLQQGQGFRAASETSPERFDVQGTQPSWMTAYTQFNNAPLQEVLDALSMKYGVEFQNVTGEYQKMRFTGQFINTNQEQALQMVLGTMGLTYTADRQVIRLD